MKLKEDQARSQRLQGHAFDQTDAEQADTRSRMEGELDRKRQAREGPNAEFTGLISETKRQDLAVCPPALPAAWRNPRLRRRPRHPTVLTCQAGAANLSSARCPQAMFSS